MTAPRPVPVHGLFETHLTVSDLDRSRAFHRDVVGLEPAVVVSFRDPDGHGHGLECLALLDELPRPELGVVPWSRWVGGPPA
jgi:hypothetical protein